MDAPELQPLLGRFLDAYAALHPGMAPGDRAHATLDLAQYPPRHIDQVLLQRDAFVPLQAAVILDEPDRKSVVSGKSMSERLDLGGRRIIKKQNRYQRQRYNKKSTK